MDTDLLTLMINYNSPDVHQINHAIKVYVYGRIIAESEKCNSEVLERISYATIFHDIGIHHAEKKYGSSAWNYQELEGPGVFEEIVKDRKIDTVLLERVKYLIGNHHTYSKIDDIDFQILVEADLIVNIGEKKLDKKAIQSIKSKVFKTRRGNELLEEMYLGDLA